MSNDKKPSRTPDHPVYGKGVTLGNTADIPPDCGACPGCGGLDR